MRSTRVPLCIACMDVCVCVWVSEGVKDGMNPVSASSTRRATTDLKGGDAMSPRRTTMSLQPYVLEVLLPSRPRRSRPCWPLAEIYPKPFEESRNLYGPPRHMPSYLQRCGRRGLHRLAFTFLCGRWKSLSRGPPTFPSTCGGSRTKVANHKRLFHATAHLAFPFRPLRTLDPANVEDRRATTVREERVKGRKDPKLTEIAGRNVKPTTTND